MADTKVSALTEVTTLLATDDHYVAADVTGTPTARRYRLAALTTFLSTAIQAAGTLTASLPRTLTQTWNNAGVTFVGAEKAFTSTASAALSILEQWKLGGTAVAGIVKDGSIFATNGLWKSAATSFNGANNHGIALSSTSITHYVGTANSAFYNNATLLGIPTAAQFVWSTSAAAGSTNDTGLQRTAAATVKITNGSTGLGTLIFKLPTADPAISGALWNNAGTIAISA